MTSEQDLMMKLVTAKKIMNKHNEIGRGGIPAERPSSPVVEEYSAPNPRYNIPQEYMNESLTMGHTQNDDINYPLLSESHVTQMKSSQPLTNDRILSSRLPDEIKQLMIEHPISQPSNPLTSGPTISDELVEKASRLMGTQKPKSQPQSQSQPSNESLKDMIREAVRDVLSENGLITESVSKSNDVFSFRVGKHVFEGKVTKVKKVS
jgi:hypothetical protein